MALTGELSDLSLAELIEFFCNQRKTGRLKVVYPSGPGYFYLQSGSVVHARIGALAGIEAVYYALTLPNASFTFSPAFEAPEHTINQPWTSVVLEGLRRMDEGIAPRLPFPSGEKAPADTQPKVVETKPDSKVETHMAEVAKIKREVSDFPSDPSIEVKSFVRDVPAEVRRARRSWSPIAVFGAVVLAIAVVAVPWGWYAHSKAARLANGPNSLISNVQSVAPAANTDPASEPAQNNSNDAAVANSAPSSEGEQAAASAEADLARRQREARAKERARIQEASMPGPLAPSTAKENPAVSQTTTKTQSPASAGAKRVTVQVTYDENGRETQASGGDATALRIARQKRFPAGKAGSATVTIPIN